MNSTTIDGVFSNISAKPIPPPSYKHEVLPGYDEHEESNENHVLEIDNEQDHVAPTNSLIVNLVMLLVIFLLHFNLFIGFLYVVVFYYSSTTKSAHIICLLGMGLGWIGHGLYHFFYIYFHGGSYFIDEYILIMLGCLYSITAIYLMTKA